MKTKKLFTILILATICLVFITLDTQAIDYPEIGGETPETSLEGYVRYIYLFALSIVGIAALGAITYGGITYMLSDMITSKDEAKKWIWGAITGLILALAAYLILYTINPDLVSLRAPTLTPTGNNTNNSSPETPMPSYQYQWTQLPNMSSGQDCNSRLGNDWSRAANNLCQERFPTGPSYVCCKKEN